MVCWDGFVEQGDERDGILAGVRRGDIGGEDGGDVGDGCLGCVYVDERVLLCLVLEEGKQAS